MTKLKRSECSILHLVLKKAWYDKIANGEKREEYRDVKEYYRVRIGNFIRRGAEKRSKNSSAKLVVAFSLGMRKPDLFMTVIGCNIYGDCLHPEWGEPNGEHYVLALGRQVIVTDESEETKPCKH